MRALAKIAASIVLLTTPFALAQEEQPSLEDLEEMGTELDQAPAPAPALNAVGASAVDLGVPPPAPAASTPSVTPSEPSSPALGGLQEIDIRTKVKKVSEPNLFAGAPPVPGTLRNLAMGEAPEEYEVQEGDNLFDICDQLLDEADYWPKLWSLNPGIANPHFIYPGMKLHFYAGDAENPPFLRVVTEDEIMPINKGGLIESELVKEDISGMLMRSEIPENMQVLSSSELASIPEIDEMFVLAGNARTGNEDTNLLIPAFVTQDRFPVLGTVIGGTSGAYLVDKNGEVIVDEESDGSLQVGTSYSIVRDAGPIYTETGNDFVGYRYEFIAQIKLKEKNEENVRGRVLFNRLGVQPGDLLIAFRSVKRTIPAALPAASKGAGQQIVAFTEPYMQIGGRGGYAYIDQKAGKLQEGGLYRVTQNVRTSASAFIRSQLPDTFQKSGTVYIIDSSGSAALGFIAQDVFELRLGDVLQ